MPVVSTHSVTMGPDTVTKTYNSWSRGEPWREWAALGLLRQHAPGLAPEPVSAALDALPPSIVMTRLPGRSLGGQLLTAAQTQALAAALHQLHTAVPAAELAALPPRHWQPSEAVASLRAWMTERHEVGDDPLTATAFERVRRWLGSADPDRLAAADVPAVFGLADGNLSNLVEAGGVVRLVDFEDSGRSDRAYELADLVEHVSTWVDESVDTDVLTDAVGVGHRERERFDGFRRLWAGFWLLMLLPGGPAHARNPAGTLERQVQRTLAVM